LPTQTCSYPPLFINGDAANQACEQAIREFPRDVEVYKNRGSAYQVKGDLDRAIADYTMAIEIDPKYAAAYASLATRIREIRNDLTRASVPADDCSNSEAMKGNDRFGPVVSSNFFKEKFKPKRDQAAMSQYSWFPRLTAPRGGNFLTIRSTQSLQAEGALKR
jgi:tetratricopeptide (TPR) repeat protein